MLQSNLASFTLNNQPYDISCFAGTWTCPDGIYILNIPPGTGSTLMTGGLSYRNWKAPVNLTYQPPRVISSFTDVIINLFIQVNGFSFVDQYPGTIEIVGNNFGTNASLISVNIGNYACINIIVVTAHTKLRCFVSIFNGSLSSILVNIAGQTNKVRISIFSIVLCL